MMTDNINSIEWSNKQGSRNRQAWLLLVKGEQISPFTGEDMPGMAVIRGTSYEKNGKWSNTTFRIELALGVRAILGRNGWETNTFAEGLRSAVNHPSPIDTWTDLSSALGVSVPAAMTFLREWRPKAAAALDEVDAKLSALDDLASAAQADTETITVSFGAPNNRSYAAGFWETPKGIPGYWQDGANVELIDPTKGWTKDNVTITGIVGTVLTVVQTSGRNGGYVAVTVAIVPGTTTPKAPEPVAETGGRTFYQDVPADELAVQLSAPLPEPVPAPVSPLASMADLMAKFGKK